MPVLEELERPSVQLEIDHIVEQVKPERPESNVRDALVTWFKTALLTTGLFFFIITFIMQGFRVYGSCMEPNLNTGERLLASKLSYRFGSPSRGDVVVFKYPKDPSKIFIKRIIALPGETINIHEGTVFVNGEKLREPYLNYAPHGSYGPEVVKRGKVFVMGDNRDQSLDSRFWGELPVKDIEAKGWIRYWPITKMQLIR